MARLALLQQGHLVAGQSEIAGGCAISDSATDDEVVGMAPAEECEHEMFVLIQRKKRQLAVPLMQLEGIQVDEETQQAIENWHYWVNRGYEL